MRLRTFTAADMPSVLKLVRKELGEHAVILNTEILKNGSGVTVSAAIDQDEDPIDLTPVFTSAPRNNSDLVQLQDDIRNILHFHNVPELFIAKLLQKTSEKELNSLAALHKISSKRDENQLMRLTLEKLMNNYFTISPLPFVTHSLRIMLIGPSGMGKTLTIAKMAARLTMDKQPVIVITADNKRAGGVEQLQAFTQILGLPLQVVATTKELRQLVQKIPRNTHVLIDTAGCNPFDKNDMKEVASLTGVETVEPILTLSAGGDSLDAIDMAESFARLPIRRLLVTRTDTARRYGGIICAAAAHGLQFCQMSNSSSIVDALQPVNGGTLAQLLLQYQTSSQSSQLQSSQR